MKETLLTEHNNLKEYLFEVQEGNVSLQRAVKEIQKYLQKEIWTLSLYTPNEEILERQGISKKTLFTEENRKKLKNLSDELGFKVGVSFTYPRRTAGYFFSKEEAFECIQRDNAGQWYNEGGYYEYAIIENFKPGGEAEWWPNSVDPSCERYFFKINYDDYKFHPIDEPVWAKQICNFGMG